MAHTNHQGETYSNTNGNMVDSLQVESSRPPAYNPPNDGGRGYDEEECHHSHRTITTSLLMFLFYLLTMLCTWIGVADYLGESYDRYSTNYYSYYEDSLDSIEEQQKYAYPFLCSNVLFTIALFIEIWVWDKKC